MEISPNVRKSAELKGQRKSAKSKVQEVLIFEFAPGQHATGFELFLTVVKCFLSCKTAVLEPKIFGVVLISSLRALERR